ncbi:hypothetical protein OS493_020891 [Desmophyllum pertusum]|uniref:Uncharacterized protein n=1 Tax=Desmophyllum pertusum TaxID=174260 RepID=A0A9W9YD08_9CNID|nr:hypothetical protein OS493_020891 [Desmophyllum pertusum]
MALWNVLSDLLDGSGWTGALSEAGVASSGVADSFLKATHLTRTRYGEVLINKACSSSHRSGSSQTKEREAFSQCADETSISTWEEVRKRRSSTFLFWDLIIQYETLVLLVIRAQRKRNFSLLSGPETTRILHQFEEQYLTDSEESCDRPNHEMGLIW